MYSKSLPVNQSREDLARKANISFENYGEGEAETAGIADVSLGLAAVVASGTGAVVILASGVLEAAGAVVVVSLGEAAGVAVSVFCSHAARRAALARMQIAFFIVVELDAP